MSNEQLRIHTRENRPLPFTESPIHFAVGMKNGLSSNAWGVRVEGTGDAYIYCRDIMKDIKISLHQSGKQQVAFTKESGYKMTPGSRFWNQWREPPSQRPPVPTFKLVFPGWALSLNGEDRKKGRPKKWDTNDIIIEGDDELLTVVWFFIMDEGQVPRQEGLPSEPIGILRLRQGKDLCVIAGREYERNFKTDRFTKAIVHLGADNMAIRLGGIYALERIAKDSEKDHGPIMEVLTAFVREHAPAQKEQNTPATSTTPPPGIEAILTVLGRRETTGQHRGADRLDLFRTQLAWMILPGANLRGATLCAATLWRTDLREADLRGANLSGANLNIADLRGADLCGANLSGTLLRNAILSEAVHLTAGQVQSGTDWRHAHLPEDLQYLKPARLTNV